MLQLISFVILVISLSGIALMLNRKIPALMNLPVNGKTSFKKYAFVEKFGHKTKEILEYFDHIAFIHKIVSLIKILVLKIEVKVDTILHSLRREAKIKNDKKQIIK